MGFLRTLPTVHIGLPLIFYFCSLRKKHIFCLLKLRNVIFKVHKYIQDISWNETQHTCSFKALFVETQADPKSLFSEKPDFVCEHIIESWQHSYLK